MANCGAFSPSEAELQADVPRNPPCKETGTHGLAEATDIAREFRHATAPGNAYAAQFVQKRFETLRDIAEKKEARREEHEVEAMIKVQLEEDELEEDSEDSDSGSQDEEEEFEDQEEVTSHERVSLWSRIITFIFN